MTALLALIHDALTAAHIHDADTRDKIAEKITAATVWIPIADYRELEERFTNLARAHRAAIGAPPLLTAQPHSLTVIRRFLTAHRRQGEAYGKEDTDEIIRLLRAIGSVVWLELPDSEQTPGICSVCGCTETDACPPGCSWANTAQTLCTTCLGV